MRKCPACGERHQTPEEAAERHAPRLVKKVDITVVEPQIPEVIEILVLPEASPNTVSDEPETREVTYRGRQYTGEVTDEGVLITLKNGAMRVVKDA